VRLYFKRSIPREKIFRGQGLLIMDKLSDDPGEGKSTVQLANEIKDELVTRQTAERVVAFYVSVWLKKGYVGYAEVDPGSSQVVVRAVPIPGAAVQPIGPGGFPGTEPIEEEEEPGFSPEVVAVMPSLAGKKLGEAVLIVLEFKAKALTEMEIVELLRENGSEVNLNQVRTAVQNLARKEAVTRNGDKISVAA
jgi:hypothetical protein